MTLKEKELFLEFLELNDFSSDVFLDNFVITKYFSINNVQVRCSHLMKNDLLDTASLKSCVADLKLSMEKEVFKHYWNSLITPDEEV